MIFTSHMLAGAAVASNISSTPMAITLALFSHYLVDSIPHSEYSIKNIQEGKWKKSYFDFLKIFLDFSVGIILILILSKNPFIAILGGITAILPDGLTFLGFIFPNNKILSLHQKIHYQGAHYWRNIKISSLGKFLAQVLIISLSIFFLL
ncbi:MAG: hypothetical protein Q7R53_01600 [bacterium]|nr:hypothetical protein [bacterium]